MDDRFSTAQALFKQRKFEVPVLFPDIKKAKVKINWSPKINFEKGLKLTINSYKNNNV